MKLCERSRYAQFLSCNTASQISCECEGTFRGLRAIITRVILFKSYANGCQAAVRVYAECMGPQSSRTVRARHHGSFVKLEEEACHSVREDEWYGEEISGGSPG